MKDPKAVGPLLPSPDLDLNRSFSTVEIVRYLSFNVESTFENPPPSSTAAALTSAGNHTRQHVHGAPTPPLPPLPPPPPPPPLSSRKGAPWKPEATTQKNSPSDRGCSSPSVYHYLLLEGGEGGGKRRRRSSGKQSMSETDHDTCQIVPRTVTSEMKLNCTSERFRCNPTMAKRHC